MTSTRNIRDLFGKTAYDVNGDKLGDVNEIFVDDNTGEPTFVAVNHGLFGLSSSLVPLRGHSFDGDDVHLAFDKERIKDAPDFDTDTALSVEEQATIYRHYGIDTAENRTAYTRETVYGAPVDRDLGDQHGSYTERRDVEDHDQRVVAGAAAGTGMNRDIETDRELADAKERKAARTDDVLDGGIGKRDGETLVASEERLNVDKERVQTGEARLRKYVVHDTETVEVPVTREEVRVERTPITDGDVRAGGLAGGIGELSEEEASVTLHEERVTVNKETVPVEEVSLCKDTVRDTETFTEEVAKERIEADVDGPLRDHR